LPSSQDGRTHRHPYWGSPFTTPSEHIVQYFATIILCPEPSPPDSLAHSCAFHSLSNKYVSFRTAIILGQFEVIGSTALRLLWAIRMQLAASYWRGAQPTPCHWQLRSWASPMPSAALLWRESGPILSSAALERFQAIKGLNWPTFSPEMHCQWPRIGLTYLQGGTASLLSNDVSPMG
jgi:hypothetical protein